MSVSYNLENAPWCFITPTPDQICSLNRHFSKKVMSDIFAKLRENPTLSHHAVILPELGGITAGEMALMYLRSNMLLSKQRKQIRKHKATSVDKNVETVNPKKRKQFSVWAKIATIQNSVV